MRLALDMAKRAYDMGEVPVGAVLVHENTVIGEGWNQPISSHDTSAHAEIMALRAASQQHKNYRLPNTTLYVTIEPCTMCIGAIVHARVQRLVFGALEPKAGCVVSQMCLLDASHWNHKVLVDGGVLAKESAALMQQFFKMRREQIKHNKNH